MYLRILHWILHWDPEHVKGLRTGLEVHQLRFEVLLFGFEVLLYGLEVLLYGLDWSRTWFKLRFKGFRPFAVVR